MKAADRISICCGGCSHWLMKQPDLDEEALRLQIHGKDLAVQRQTMADTVAPVTVTSPSGATRQLTLAAGDPGVWSATIPASELGLWQATDGTLKALINVGPTNPEGIFRGHIHHRHAQAAGAGHRR